MARLPAGMTITSMRTMTDGLGRMVVDISVSRKLIHSYAVYLWAFGDLA